MTLCNCSVLGAIWTCGICPPKSQNIGGGGLPALSGCCYLFPLFPISFCSLCSSPCLWFPQAEVHRCLMDWKGSRGCRCKAWQLPLGALKPSGIEICRSSSCRGMLSVLWSKQAVCELMIGNVLCYKPVWPLCNTAQADLILLPFQEQSSNSKRQLGMGSCALLWALSEH